eukprot:1581509-Karenia_brevis.AAC.1
MKLLLQPTADNTAQIIWQRWRILQERKREDVTRRPHSSTKLGESKDSQARGPAAAIPWNPSSFEQER